MEGRDRGREGGRERGGEKNTDTFICAAIITYYRLINLQATKNYVLKWWHVGIP